MDLKHRTYIEDELNEIDRDYYMGTYKSGQIISQLAAVSIYKEEYINKYNLNPIHAFTCNSLPKRYFDVLF